MLNSHLKTLLFIAIILFTFSACQEKKIIAHLSGDFFLRYSYDTGDLKSEARFRDKEGKLSKLPKAPTINGAEMRIINSDNLIYIISKSEKLLSNYTFAWQDISGDTSSINISVPLITDFYFSEKKINLSKEQTIQWKGEPIQENESLVFLWEKEGEAVSMEINQPTNDNSLKLPLSQIQKLKPGKWILYLVRKQRNSIQKPPFNSTTVFEFYTNSKSFEVY